MLGRTLLFYQLANISNQYESGNFGIFKIASTIPKLWNFFDFGPFSIVGTFKTPVLNVTEFYI